ncbi:hypothetical protein [Streptomyces kanasensis]|uniref:hypothetical protein n=1 Tax=Streptomyces kanasensis TaxID=936756 RepID=UPI0036F67FB5
MSGDEETRAYRIGGDDARPRRLTTVTELLGGLDDVGAPADPAREVDGDDAGLERLMAWMAAPAPRAPEAAPSGTAVKMLVLGGAEAARFVATVTDRSAPAMAEGGLPRREGQPAEAVGTTGTGRPDADDANPPGFGRIGLAGDLHLYLFAPGAQLRSPSGPDAWRDLAEGALGAVVLADTRRLTECFVHLDRVEASGLPYVVGTLRPGGDVRPPLSAIREALMLDASVPLLECDVSSRADTVRALRAVVTRALDGSETTEDTPEDLTGPSALLLLTQVGCLLH